MASGDLIRKLFLGYTKRDDALFRSTAEEIIRVERKKNHRLLADDLEHILLNSRGERGPNAVSEKYYDVPKDRERGFSLLEIEEHDFDWSRLVLPPTVLSVLQEMANEHHRSDLLRAGGLYPKRRALFFGPPGCGKTITARVLAGVLGFPLALVRFDAVISSYLGETASNLRRVFEFLERGRWVVLFDEFDAISKDRDNPFEHGELKRVVNTLLQLMDAFHGESLLIAATNHEKLLDNAIWRRFDAIVHFGYPSSQDRALLLRLFFKGFDTRQLDLLAIARRLKGASGGDVEWVTVEAARRAVLDGRNLIAKCDAEEALELFRMQSSWLRMASTQEGVERAEPPSDN